MTGIATPPPPASRARGHGVDSSLTSPIDRDVPRLGFRRDIEGMRAVAVLLVVFHHVGASVFGGGYVGVDVFFVISGFLITSLLLRELTTTGTISIVGFYARRVVRLLPASTLVLLATLVGAWLWLPAIRLPELAVDAVTSAFYGVNYRLAVQGTDYWASEGDPSPLQHYWSLAVEEQFYLVWPLLLLVSSLLWWKRRRISRATIVVTLLALVLVSLLASIQQTGYAVSWAYFGSHTRAWELAIGALVAVTAGVFTRTASWLAALMTWTGLAAVVWAAVTFNEATAFPGYAAAVPVLGTALVLAGGCASPRRGAQTMLRLPPLQVIGTLSYGWYLWHWPVLMIGPAALGREPSLSVNVGLAVISLALAALSYQLVENPIRRRRWLRVVPVRSIAMGVVLTTVAAVAAVAVVAYAPSTAGRGAAADTASTLSAAPEPADALRDEIAASVATQQVPGNLTPALADAADDRTDLSEAGCHLSFTEVSTSSSCVYGDPDSETTVVLIGDSHAAQWFPALELLAREQGWRLFPMTKSACHASSVELWQGRLERLYRECSQWREQTLRRVAEMDPDLVIMASIDGGSSRLVDETADSDRVWAEGWAESFRRVAVPGTERVLLLDTPRPGSNLPECLSESLDAVAECVPETADAIRLPARRQLASDLAKAEGVTVIDPTPWFCTDTTCPVIVGNVLVYRDTNHITSTYARLLAPLLLAELPGDSS